ncbi:protein BONZAI 3-like isoform X4 [Alnus glutinosa]|uniref:protein BONZAI 3-like isoform X4 n=1 Tax=Alnus glutinosa TaxID=3517 RepID=UPI002D78D565|nr:protein BONZAI 3-like isoform X4 [Alnus glutinosa]
MGNCFSDLEGGKQAVGAAQLRSTAAATSNNNNGGHNDAVEFFYRSRGLHPLFTQVQLSLSASNLIDRDFTSKSDPMAVVYAKKIDGKLEELGRTEVVLNSLHPEWIEKVTVAFQFEIVQPLVFHVYDVDTTYHNIPVKTLNLKDQDFLGEATCVLSEIVTKQSRRLTLNLHNKNGKRGLRNFGALTIHAEETVASRSAVEMIFRCSHLDNKDLFSKSDPFLKISRIVESGDLIPICKTEVVNNNLNPTWKPLCMSMNQFGSKDNPLIIECFDFNSSGNHVLIGKLQKSVADLEKLHKERSGANLTLPSSHYGHEKVLKGQLFVDQFCQKEQYSFLDYISSGFELNFMVAVDFTASNGNPRNPDSLHYIDPSGRLNSYQRVEGVEGIMAAYASALRNVALAGPTLFGQVINTAAQITGQSLSYTSNKYFVLLIITDGVLTDLQETKDALVRASDLPLSILIVGVGGADFSQMEQVLDADGGQRLESSTGRVATHDIVQFVPMREVHSGQISVVQALLEELPGQFLTYMRSRDIKPLSPHVPQTSA